MTTNVARRVVGLTVAATLAVGGLALAVQASGSHGDAVQRTASVRPLHLQLHLTTTTVRRTTTTTAAPATTITAAPTTTVAPPVPTTAPRRVTPTTRPPATPTTVAPIVSPPVTTALPATGGLGLGTLNDLLAQVNARRATGTTCGGVAYAPVPSLTLATDLVLSSQIYALDMATRSFFSHTGLDGSDPGTRISRTGYHWSAWAENIAAGQPSPADAMAAWWASAPHCEDFMSPAVTQIGFGLGQNPSSAYGSYWVSDLARPA